MLCRAEGSNYSPEVSLTSAILWSRPCQALWGCVAIEQHDKNLGFRSFYSFSTLLLLHNQWVTQAAAACVTAPQLVLEVMGSIPLLFLFSAQLITWVTGDSVCSGSEIPSSKLEALLGMVFVLGEAVAGWIYPTITHWCMNGPTDKAFVFMCLLTSKNAIAHMNSDQISGSALKSGKGQMAHCLKENFHI